MGDDIIHRRQRYSEYYHREKEDQLPELRAAALRGGRDDAAALKLSVRRRKHVVDSTTTPSLPVTCLCNHNLTDFLLIRHLTETQQDRIGPGPLCKSLVPVTVLLTSVQIHSPTRVLVLLDGSMMVTSVTIFSCWILVHSWIWRTFVLNPNLMWTTV